MSSNEPTKVTTEEARGAETHNRGWLLAGLAIGLVVVVIVFVFL